MKKAFSIFIFFILAATCYGQLYNKEKHCGADTINVDTYNRKTGESIKYKAFECTQVSNFGIRVDIGFNTYSYSNNTKQWLGDHNGALFGLTLAYKNFNFGVKFKPATVNPKSVLVFNGDTLPKNADLNPIKFEYDISYSLALKYNFAIEPYIALTNNSFHVINEKDLNKNYKISKIIGLTTGLTLNKYFKLNEFKFLAVFVKYGYGFTNFKKANSQLGRGYSDFSVGIAYKAFYKRNFLNPIN